MSPSSSIIRRLLPCRTCPHIWRNPVYVNTAPLRSSPSALRAYSTRREDESRLKEHQHEDQRQKDGEQKHEEKQRAGQSSGHTGKGAQPKRPKIYNLYISAAFVGLAAVLYLGWPDASSNSNIFDRPRFTTFTIISREELSPTNIILTLRPSIPVTPTSDPYHANWERGTWSVEFKQPQLQIARSYTPLPPLPNTQNGDLRFLIRKECKGEVSSYLHSLPVGSSVSLRGPNEEIAMPGEVTDVVFLAGGTGIAPALQVAYTLLDVRGAREDGTKPRIRIVWANRRREECQGGDDITSRQAAMLWQSKPTTDEMSPQSILVRELQEMQQRHPNQLMVDYLVDEEGAFIDQKRITNLIRLSNSGGASSVKSLPRHESIDKKLIFVSGPEGFVNFFAGPKKWEGASGIEGQGEVGGVIGRMRLRDWKLWKL